MSVISVPLFHLKKNKNKTKQNIRSFMIKYVQLATVILSRVKYVFNSAHGSSIVGVVPRNG